MKRARTSTPEVVAACVPVGERYPAYKSMQPHLDGLFEGMHVPVEGHDCVNKELCGGCMHKFPLGEELTGLLDIGKLPTGEAIWTTITEPAAALTLHQTLGSFGINPADLRMLTTDPTFVRLIRERLGYLDRKNSPESVPQGIDLRPINVLYEVISGLSYSQNRNIQARLPYLIAALDVNYMRRFIEDTLYMRGHEVLIDFFYGEFENGASKAERKSLTAKKMGIAPNAIDRALKWFAIKMQLAVKEGTPPDLTKLVIDHRILGSISGTKCATLFGESTTDSRFKRYSVLDWLNNSKEVQERWPGWGFISNLNDFKEALALTTDSSLQQG